MRIRENRTYAVWICMAGFLAGIVYANLPARNEIADMGIFQEHFFSRFSQADTMSAGFLWYVARIRLMPALFLAVFGCTRFRKGAAAVMLLWTDFSCGLIMTAAVIKMGVKGWLFCLAAFTPHLFFYAAGYLILLWYLLRYPGVQWNLSKTAATAFLLVTGILLECYVNPVLLELFLKTFS